MTLKGNPIQNGCKEDNHFEFLFNQRVYLSLKKYFYNYLVRRHKVVFHARDIKELSWLEVGAGVTPVLPTDFNVTYSELSPIAVNELKQLYPDKKIVACAASAIPFDPNSFDGIVCSEVLEHIEKDREAVAEMARVLKSGARLLITVPINSWLYSFDDAFVGHQRRYNLEMLTRLLQDNGFEKIRAYKVSGLIDKICLMLAVGSFKLYSVFVSGAKPKTATSSTLIVNILLPVYVLLNWVLFGFIWLESKILPWRLCSIALFVAQKKE